MDRNTYEGMLRDCCVQICLTVHGWANARGPNVGSPASKFVADVGTGEIAEIANQSNTCAAHYMVASVDHFFSASELLSRGGLFGVEVCVRSAVEAAAMAAELTNPVLSTDERLKRGFIELIWSQVEASKMSADSETMRHKIEELMKVGDTAGLVGLNRRNKRRKATDLAGGRQATSAIEALFKELGEGFGDCAYRYQSASGHSNPMVVRARSKPVQDGPDEFEIGIADNVFSLSVGVKAIERASSQLGEFFGWHHKPVRAALDQATSVILAFDGRVIDAV